MPTPLHRNSKSDTVYLGDIDVDSIEVDLSQNRTDLTVVGDSAYESPSARCAITAPRAIAVVVDLRAGDDGTLVAHSDPGGPPDDSYRLRLTFAGVAEAIENGSTRVSVQVPGLGVDADHVLLAWSCAPTVDGDVRHELLAYNTTDGEYNYAAATTAAGTVDAGWDLVIADSSVDPFAGGLEAIRVVRIGRRFVSTTEAREDFVAESGAPTLTTETRLEPLPIDASTGVDAEGALYGPGILRAAWAAKQADLRLWGPVVNEVYRQAADVPAIDATFAPVKHAQLAPASDYLRVLLRHTWYRPVPPACPRVRVRAHVTMWPTAGDSVCPVQLQAWAFNRLPWALQGQLQQQGEPPAPPVASRHTAIVTRTDNDGDFDGAGEWVDLGELTLPPLLGHMAWLTLGVGFNEGDDSHEDYDATVVRVNAVVIEPVRPVADGGLGGGFGLVEDP